MNFGHHSKRLVLVALIVSCVVAVVWWKSTERELHASPLEKITIALPTQPSTGPMFIAIEQGFFKNHGLEVVNQVHDVGAQGLKSVLENKADMVIVADTPFMFKVMSGENISIISSIANSRKAAAIVARKDRGISSVSQLKGKTVGVSLGTNMQFFLDVMLVAHGVASSDIHVVNVKPAELVKALESGQVDAVVAWHPFLSQLQQKMPNEIGVFFGEDLFSFRFNLVAKQDYIQTHALTLQKVVAALNEANQFIDQHPDRARKIVGQYIKMDEQTLEKIFDPADFELQLDQALLLSLDDQSRWAIKNGLAKNTVVPDYLKYIYLTALQKEKPEAVTLIH